MTDYSVGGDGQSIHRDGSLVALGVTPEHAAATVRRLNSPAARQEDVDLLLWLLAEQRNNVEWWVKMSKVWRRDVERLEEQLDAARTSLAFWDVLNTRESP